MAQLASTSAGLLAMSPTIDQLDFLFPPFPREAAVPHHTHEGTKRWKGMNVVKSLYPFPPQHMVRYTYTAISDSEEREREGRKSTTSYLPGF